MLAADFNKYMEDRIRIRAFTTYGTELTDVSLRCVLYNPKCQNGKPILHYRFKPEVGGKIKSLQKILTKRGYTFVTVEGVVHWPRISMIPSAEIEIEKVFEAKKSDDVHNKISTQLN